MGRVVSDDVTGIRVVGNSGGVTVKFNEIMTSFLIYTVGSVAEGRMSLNDLLSKFAPDGKGFSIPTLLSVYRVESVEDSYKKSWPLSDPEYQLPDYENKDYWNIDMHGASTRGKLELEGDELRRLIHEAYQIYTKKGLIKNLWHI